MATQQVFSTFKTPYTFRSASYAPTAINDISGGTTVDLSLSSISDTAAKNSDQVDLGASHPDEFRVMAAIEWHAAVVAGGRVDFYWSPSHNSVVTDGNPGRPDGTDGAYTGDGASVSSSVQQLQYIGSMITTNYLGVQIASIGVFSPEARYGQLIVVNGSGTTLCGTDDIESAVVMIPVAPDIQAAA